MMFAAILNKQKVKIELLNLINGRIFFRLYFRFTCKSMIPALMILLSRHGIFFLSEARTTEYTVTGISSRNTRI